MRNSQKKPIDEVQVSIRPEEIDSILGLRNTFDYFEVIGKLCFVISGVGLGDQTCYTPSRHHPGCGFSTGPGSLESGIDGSGG